MIPGIARKMMLRSATLAMGVALAAGCTPNGSGTGPAGSGYGLGTVGVALKLNNGADIQTVSYKISGNGITPLMGTISVPDPNSTVSLQIDSLPVGQGYLVELSATSTDGKTTCAGSSMFQIIGGQSTSVTVVLLCRTPFMPPPPPPPPQTGSVSITGTFDNCPVVTSFSAAPLSAPVGGTIAVTSTAQDSDASDTVTFAWTADSGTFANAAAANTTFTCTAVGTATLKVTVNDGQCTDNGSVMVTCTAPPPSCGNGVLDPGEECDPPGAANNCDSNCKIIPVCGNGKVETGEQCDPPDGTTCDAHCQTITIAPTACTEAGGAPKADGTPCDDGKKCTTGDVCTAGVCGGAAVTCPAPADSCHVAGACDEATGACTNPMAANGTACNDGNACTQTDTCVDGTCTGGSPVLCGAASACKQVGTCDPASGMCVSANVADGTTCDDGKKCTTGDVCTGGVCGGTALMCTAPATCNEMSGMCEGGVVDTCTPCEQGAIDAGLCDPALGCDNLTDAGDKALCMGAQSCILTNHCATGTKDVFINCFCGTAAGTSCLTAPNGPCVTPFVSASKAASTTDAATRIFDLMFPLGHATQKIQCDHDFCQGPPPVCSL